MRTVLTLTFLLYATGCAAGNLNVKVQQALVFEDRVHAQVTNLEALFETSVPLLPADKQVEARTKLAVAKAVLADALEAKDAALQAALAASAPTVDVTAVVTNIVTAVQGVVAVVGAFGAPRAIVDAEHKRAATLARGL